MVSAVSSSSAALTVLQTQAPGQVASGRRDQDPLRAFLDPRSVHALAPQSLDALLKLRSELRGDHAHGPQAHQLQQDVHSASGAGTPGQSGMLAVWANAPKVHMQSRLDFITERWESMKAHATVPLNSPLMPWNSPDVVQQLKDMDKYGDESDAPYRAYIGNDSAIHKAMDETPAEDVARIKSMGGEIWYESSHLRERPSDKDFFRNIRNYVLYGLNFDQPIDPSNERSQAFLNGTAQMIRGSSITEFYSNSFEYTMYAYNADAKQYKWVGGWDRNENNIRQIVEDLGKKNPTMKVTWMAEDDDVAFILYPKTASVTPAATAAAESSAAGTGTNQTAAAAR
ncbi:hypothetical protein [Methylobacterium sp. J-077]|uniref:hypothetical protein n=1 Tax=Methylobacterium sp. J-077 TaxID=2836656 RepID=UPI001FBBF673|nr:hypothetical protein [Methylobacterium sp. J-077]MCJ2126318.1 hypothetical protein [Methylobacterium sp. J-077]